MPSHHPLIPQADAHWHAGGRGGMRPTCAPESLLSPQGDSSQPTSFSVPTFDAFFSSSLTMRTTSSAGVAAYFLSSFLLPFAVVFYKVVGR